MPHVVGNINVSWTPDESASSSLSSSFASGRNVRFLIRGSQSDPGRTGTLTVPHRTQEGGASHKEQGLLAP